jgi:hypothetical protein
MDYCMGFRVCGTKVIPFNYFAGLIIILMFHFKQYLVSFYNMKPFEGGK